MPISSSSDDEKKDLTITGRSAMVKKGRRITMVVSIAASLP
jgi:hypothetical protein